jgi:hypothetical protein
MGVGTFNAGYDIDLWKKDKYVYPGRRTDFAFTVDSRLSTTEGRVALPTDVSGTYDCTVYWGDGSSDYIDTYDQAEIVHTYSIPGIYNIRIDGQFDGIRFANDTDSRWSLIYINNWGTSKFTDTNQEFQQCVNLREIRTRDLPDLTAKTAFRDFLSNMDSLRRINRFREWGFSGKTSFRLWFNSSEKFNQDLHDIDLSSATDFFRAFRGNTTFNGRVCNWDLSSATGMGQMFYDNHKFNRPLTNWKLNTTTSVIMNNTFWNCYEFDNDISSLDTSRVNAFNGTFGNCYKFNQPIDHLDFSNASGLVGMFQNCYKLNQPVSSWTFPNPSTDLSSIFRDCRRFNQDLSGWTINNVDDMQSMLEGTAFSDANYDKLLPAWEGQTHNNDVIAHFGNAKYSAGAPATAHAALIADGWTITDGGPA